MLIKPRGNTPQRRRTVVQVPKPNAGLDYSQPSTMLPPNQMANCDEVYVDDNSFGSNPGTTFFASTNTYPLHGTIMMLRHIKKMDNTTEYLIVHTIYETYYYNTSTGRFVMITEPSTQLDCKMVVLVEGSSNVVSRMIVRVNGTRNIISRMVVYRTDIANFISRLTVLRQATSNIPNVLTVLKQQTDDIISRVIVRCNSSENVVSRTVVLKQNSSSVVSRITVLKEGTVNLVCTLTKTT